MKKKTMPETKLDPSAGPIAAVIMIGKAVFIAIIALIAVL